MKQVNLKFVNSILLIAIGLFVSLGVSAQELTITGQIVDATGEPVIGANVLVKGTTVGTITDFDGNFSIKANSDATIQISFIGYQPLELPANSPLFAKKIVLRDDTQLLDDVVIIGYGQVKKGDATGSILSVKPDDFNKGNQIKAEDALVGKLAGVNVVPGSGELGSNSKIRIRMGSSLKAENNPLIIIDGFPQRADANMNAINPNDIESFTVLKDASATAIYGSRASNGVIIITTKKGAEGAVKPSVNYNTNFSVSTVGDKLDVLSADDFRKVLKSGEFTNGEIPESYYGTASTDWQDEILRNGFGQDHNLSVTGAYKKVPYRVSVGYTNQHGIVKSNDYNRTNLGIGANPKFFDKHLSIDINVKGSFENNHGRDGSIISSAAFYDPTRPIYDSTYGTTGPGLGYWMWRTLDGNIDGDGSSNPMAAIELEKKNNHTDRSIGNIAFNYKVHGLEDLTLNLNMGYDVSKMKGKSETPKDAPQMWTGNQKDGTDFREEEIEKYRSKLLDIYVNYNKDISEKQNFSVMGGYGWQRFWFEKGKSQTDWAGKQLAEPTAEEQELYLISFFGRANWSYDNRYMLTATVRADASSRFAKDSRWGYFPSVAFGWRLNNEAFLKDVEALSDLKLRLSYGQTGQQDIGSYYVYMPSYMVSYDNARYKFGDTWYNTYRPNGYDPKIKWETSETFNIGIDFGFLNNRISGSIDAFRRNTKDLLNTISVPAGSNFKDQIETNIGDMKGKGIEIAVTAIPVKTRNWEWSVSGNFTWTSSEITKLNVAESENNKTQTKTGNAGGREWLQLHTVGETPNTFFLMRQAYDSNGNYLDNVYLNEAGEPLNGYDKDGKPNTGGVSDANKYITGKSSLAPYYFGFSTRISYKNWDLGINAHGSAGNYVYNYVKANNGYENLYTNGRSSNVLYSTIENKQAQQRRYSDHYLEKGDFLRIDNIRLGYTFDKLWSRSSNLTVSVAVQNPFIITGYSGLDPEIFDGIDRNTYQRPRVFMMGLNLNF